MTPLRPFDTKDFAELLNPELPSRPSVLPVSDEPAASSAGSVPGSNTQFYICIAVFAVVIIGGGYLIIQNWSLVERLDELSSDMRKLREQQELAAADQTAPMAPAKTEYPGNKQSAALLGNHVQQAVNGSSDAVISPAGT